MKSCIEFSWPQNGFVVQHFLDPVEGLSSILLDAFFESDHSILSAVYPGSLQTLDTAWDTSITFGSFG